MGQYQEVERLNFHVVATSHFAIAESPPQIYAELQKGCLEKETSLTSRRQGSNHNFQESMGYDYNSYLAILLQDKVVAKKGRAHTHHVMGTLA